MSTNLLPNSTGLDIGSTAQRWDAFLRDLNVSGTVSPLSVSQLTSGNINSVLWVDGVTYTTIAAAIAALPSTGGMVITPPHYRETITTTLNVGSSSTPVQLVLSKDTILTLNITDGTSYGIKVFNGSSIVSPGNIGSANGVGPASIATASTFNGAGLIANGQIDGSQEYFALENLYIVGHTSATITSAAVDLQSVFVPSYMRDVIILPQGTIGLRIRNTPGGNAFGPFSIDNCWFQGGSVAGSIPVSIEAVTGGGLMNNINFLGGAIEHAGTGLFHCIVDGSAGAAGAINGVVFQGTYFENAFAGCSGIKFRDVTNWQVNACAFTVAGVDAVRIEQSGAGRAGAGTINGLKDISGYTNLVNDTVNSITIGSVVSNGSLPFYLFTNPGFVQGTPTICGPARITGNLAVNGTSTLTGDVTMVGNAAVFGNTSVVKVTSYNSFATVGNGIPAEYAVVDLTAQTATIGTTTLYTTSAVAGQYRLCWNAKITTAATTGAATSTLGPLTIVYTDPDSVAVTLTAAAQIAAGTIATSSAANTTGTVLVGVPMLLNCKAATVISYAVTYASNTAAQMAFNLHITLERL